FEEAILPVDELLFCEKIKDIEDLASDRVDIARESEERAVEEREEILLRADMTGGDVREDVHPKGGLGSKFGLDCLGLAEEVILHELVDVIFIFRDQNRLTIRSEEHTSELQSR